jgi:hypothetical protein
MELAAMKNTYLLFIVVNMVSAGSYKIEKMPCPFM